MASSLCSFSKRASTISAFLSLLPFFLNLTYSAFIPGLRVIIYSRSLVLSSVHSHEITVLLGSTCNQLLDPSPVLPASFKDYHISVTSNPG